MAKLTQSLRVSAIFFVILSFAKHLFLIGVRYNRINPSVTSTDKLQIISTLKNPNDVLVLPMKLSAQPGASLAIATSLGSPFSSLESGGGLNAFFVYSDKTASPPFSLWRPGDNLPYTSDLSSSPNPPTHLHSTSQVSTHSITGSYLNTSTIQIIVTFHQPIESVEVFHIKIQSDNQEAVAKDNLQIFWHQSIRIQTGISSAVAISSTGHIYATIISRYYQQRFIKDYFGSFFGIKSGCIVKTSMATPHNWEEVNGTDGCGNSGMLIFNNGIYWTELYSKQMCRLHKGERVCVVLPDIYPHTIKLGPDDSVIVCGSTSHLLTAFSVLVKWKGKSPFSLAKWKAYRYKADLTERSEIEFDDETVNKLGGITGCGHEVNTGGLYLTSFDSDRIGIYSFV